MASQFLPPPTYADVILVDQRTRVATFNPIWLNWFIQLAQVISASGGGGGGAIQHNSLAGLQGGGGVEFFHLTNAAYGVLFNATSSLYTPSLVNVANVSSSTPHASQYVRFGPTTFVTGMLAATTSVAATSSSIRISLPVASNFVSNFQCCGTAYTDTIVSEGASIQADTVNHQALMKWITSSASARNMYYTFGYTAV